MIQGIPYLQSVLAPVLALIVWSLVIFFVNWGFDTNYMYTGPHNDTAVPFIPARWMAWPFNYVSYVVVGLVLLNAVYALLRLCQGRLERRRAPRRGCASSPSRPDAGAPAMASGTTRGCPTACAPS